MPSVFIGGVKDEGDGAELLSVFSITLCKKKQNIKKTVTYFFNHLFQRPARLYFTSSLRGSVNPVKREGKKVIFVAETIINWIL